MSNKANCKENARDTNLSLAELKPIRIASLGCCLLMHATTCTRYYDDHSYLEVLHIVDSINFMKMQSSGAWRPLTWLNVIIISIIHQLRVEEAETWTCMMTAVWTSSMNSLSNAAIILQPNIKFKDIKTEAGIYMNIINKDNLDRCSTNTCLRWYEII